MNATVWEAVVVRPAFKRILASVAIITAYVAGRIGAPGHPLLWGILGFMFPIAGVLFAVIVAGIRNRAATAAGAVSLGWEEDVESGVTDPDASGLRTGPAPPPVPSVLRAWCGGLIPPDVHRCPYCAGPQKQDPRDKSGIALTHEMGIE